MNHTSTLVDEALDPEAISAIIGRPSTPRHIRIKPGNSIVVGTDDSWLRFLCPDAAVKVDKTAKRAQENNLRHHFFTRGDLTIQHGEIALDPRLFKALHGAKLTVNNVLNYNPMRRLVMRDGDTTVRVYGKPPEHSDALDALLAQADIPVPAARGTLGDPRIVRYEFVGDADLFHRPTSKGYARAGELFAQLHTRVDPAGTELARRRPSLQQTIDIHAELLRPLLPDAERRLVELPWPREAERPSRDELVCVVHGDASADQVLTDSTTGDAWLTDFDRAGLGTPGTDLGSFIAMELAAGRDVSYTRAFLDAYVDNGGTLPRDLDAFTAVALIIDLTQPLRHAHPAWRDAIHARIDLVDRLRTQGLPL